MPTDGVYTTGIPLSTHTLDDDLPEIAENFNILAGLIKYYQLTYSASITVNWINGATQYVTLTGNPTFVFSNPAEGQVYRLKLKQDATGGRTVTWPTIKWRNSTTPTLTTTPNKEDIVTLLYIDGTYYADTALNF